MTHAFTGGCRCGALRYHVAAEPMVMLHCQCHDCQHLSGTGHSSYVVFSGNDAKQSGDAKVHPLKADSGKLKYHAGCLICGSPVSLTFEAMPQLFVVHATSLDDPTRFQPQAIVYAARAQPWDQLDASLRRYEAGLID